MMGVLGSGLGLAIFFGVFIVFKWINILNEYERGVIFRFGRLLGEPKGPGLISKVFPNFCFLSKFSCICPHTTKAGLFFLIHPI